MKKFSPKVELKLSRFLNSAEAFVLQIAENSVERSCMNRYNNVKRCLELAILETGLTSIVHYYGSRLARNSIANSDLDFFIEVGNNFSTALDQEDAARLLYTIKQGIEESSHFRVKIFLPKARFPFLRINYIRTNFACDIIVTSGLGVSLTNIMNHLNSIQPQILPLFHFLRIWLSINGISIKRYTQYLILLFYLQRKNYMPSIECIQKGLKKIFVDGLEVQYNPNRTLKSYKTAKMENFKNHLIGYFKFYANLNFSDFVLSTYSGEFIQRDVYEEQFEDFDIDTPLCIAGPIGYLCDRNSGKRPGKTTLAKFQRICQLSPDFLVAKGWK